jgi:hypothetical protein
VLDLALERPLTPLSEPARVEPANVAAEPVREQAEDGGASRTH